MLAFSTILISGGRVLVRARAAPQRQPRVPHPPHHAQSGTLLQKR